ncbi:MAG: hypothetical protein ACRDX8_02435 [Acidimicrobiales bacterium]
MSATGDPEVDRRFARAHKVAEAVLYEGFVLYPYRASSVRNQVRWQWGVLAPAAFCDSDSSEDWEMRTECILDGGPEATIWMRVQFLTLRARNVHELRGDDFVPVPSLEVGDRLITTWDEATEHEVNFGPISIGRLGYEPAELPIDIAAEHETEMLTDPEGTLVGKVVLDRAAIKGRVLVRVAKCDSPFMMHRLTVEVHNLTEWSGPAAHRDEVVRRSLLSVHTLIAVESGDFISHRDPPAFARDAVAACDNKGTYPILADDDDKIILSSRIILDDHPEVAPESEGDYCDATEYDEILSLMVLSLSDEEKREARQTDARSAAIIDRCDNMPPEVWKRLHGAIRSFSPVVGTDAADIGPADLGPADLGLAGLDPGLAAPGFGSWPGGDIQSWSEFDTVAAAQAAQAQGEPSGQRGDAGPGPDDAGPDPARPGPGDDAGSGPGDDVGPGSVPWWSPEADKSVHPMRDTVVIDGTVVSRGSRVRLRPRRSADAQDLFLAGRVALVEGVLNDVDGGVSLALSLPDDPATELHQWYGRFLYFHPDECEPVASQEASAEADSGNQVSK